MRAIFMLDMKKEEKYRSTLLSVMVTLILRSSTWVTVMVMDALGTNPFFDAALNASVLADEKSGISAAPASAAASAPRWIWAARAYQPPMSTAKPVKAISGTSSMAVMT